MSVPLRFARSVFAPQNSDFTSFNQRIGLPFISLIKIFSVVVANRTVFLFRKLSLTILCVNAAELQSKDCPPSKDSASFSTNNNQPQCVKADNFFAPISATRMGNKKEQTLLNRFRLGERLFENTLKSLQQNVLDNQPVSVLRTILRNLSHRHQQLTDITQQLTGFLANDALETFFDSISRISSEFENVELQVSLKETDHHLPTRSSSTASRQFQQNFSNEYTDFPPVSPPLSQSQQQPPLPMDQTAGSVFPTAACQLQSVVEASTTPAVTLCSGEPTPIVTCGNPFGTLAARVPPVLPQTRRQNSAVHPFQTDDRSKAHPLAENTYLVPPNPASVIQLPFDCLAPDRTPLETQSNLINANTSPVPHTSRLAPTEPSVPVLVSRLPNSYQFEQSLQTRSNFLPVPPSQFNQFRFVSQQQLPHATVSSTASNIAFLQSNFEASLPLTTNGPVFTESLSRPFPNPEPFPPSSITAESSFAATSHPAPINAISTTFDGFSRPIASTYHPTLQPSTYIPTHTQPQAIKLPPLQLPMFDGDPLQYHDWINTFKATVDSNRSITDTHRITYLQNSVAGPAKDLIKGYSYNPTFYAAALADIEKRFGDADYIVSSRLTSQSWKATHNFLCMMPNPSLHTTRSSKNSLESSPIMVFLPT